MTLHTNHQIHTHSLKAYREERPKLNGRKREIFDYLCRNGAASDREIMSALGYSDMNAIRPRVTEMIQLGVLREIKGDYRCDLTGKLVRKVDINYSQPEQMRLV